MSWEVIEGHWQHYADDVKQRWDKLTDAQLATIAGKRQSLADQIQEIYGLDPVEVQRQLEAFEACHQQALSA